MEIFAGRIINPRSAPAVDLSGDGEFLPAGSLDAADYLPALEEIDKPLVVFLGGFCDASTLRFYDTALEYRDGASLAEPPAFSPERPFPWPEPARHGAAKDHDVYYRCHDTRAHILRLMERYHLAGRAIALVGHSWGGASVYKLAQKSGLPVKLLATLDPVSIFPLGLRNKPRNVRRWVNVSLDYNLADLRDSSNLTALIGRPWGKSARADSSYDFIATWPGAALPGHAWCYEMFNFYVRPELEGVR